MSNTPSELSLLEELSDEIDRVKAKNAALIGQVARLGDDITKLLALGNALRDSCSHFGYVSAEYEFRRAERRIADWDKFCAEKGIQ